METRKEIDEILERACSDEGARLAAAAIAEARARGVVPTCELREEEIMSVLKISYIADRFFGRSRSWLCHKLNHDVVNGRKADLTPDERARLRSALETIASELQDLADRM